MNLSIPKRTGTYADTLQAIGIADLLHALCEEEPLILDRGSEFQVSVKEWKPENWHIPDPGYPYIWDSKKEPRPPAGNILDYRQEVKRRDAAREASKANAKARKRVKDKLQEQGIATADAPKPELALATILASMRKGWDGDRQLYRWLAEDQPRALLWTKHRLGLDNSQVPDPKWSNTQFLNPITGKGVHSPKTVARAANAINPALTDPFDDWLRLRGAFATMLTYRDGDDFKLFVLEPAQASPSTLAEIAADLRKMNLWGGVKLDINAVLKCTTQMIWHSDVMANGPVRLKGLVPRDVIAGLREAYFKSLGTAAALMGDTLFPLPDWFRIDTREEAGEMLELISEFIGSENDSGCLGTLNEKFSDECSTLQQFRSWLSTGDLQDLLLFHAQFAVHLMQKRAKQEWNRPFSTPKLTILLSKRYAMNEIVTDSGFLSVARAIRNATIYSVGETARVKVSTQFGLAQKWKQKLRTGKAEFVAAVADFVQQYNWEVINRFNRQYHVVETTALDKLVNLIDAHGPEVVGLLLLAYGYAQAPATETKVPAEGGNA